MTAQLAEPRADTRSIRTGHPSGSRRDAPAGRRTGRQVIPHIILAAFIVYFALPFWWLIVASTKSQQTLFDGKTSPLWFGGSFDLFGNISSLFSYSGGLYAHWLGNSFLYAIAGGVGATVLSVLAGYGFSMYGFRGRRLFFAIVLGSVMVPATVLVIPLFVLMSGAHLTNTMWAVILPSMLNPFAVYISLFRVAFMSSYRQDMPGNAPFNADQCAYFMAHQGQSIPGTTTPDFSWLASCQAVVTNNDLWIAAIGWGVVFFVVGIVFFWQAENKYGRG